MIGNERIICRRIIAAKFNNYFVSLASNLNYETYNEIPITSNSKHRSCPKDHWLIETCIYSLAKLHLPYLVEFIKRSNKNEILIINRLESC